MHFEVASVWLAWPSLRGAFVIARSRVYGCLRGAIRPRGHTHRGLRVLATTGVCFAVLGFGVGQRGRATTANSDPFAGRGFGLRQGALARRVGAALRRPRAPAQRASAPCTSKSGQAACLLGWEGSAQLHSALTVGPLIPLHHVPIVCCSRFCARLGFVVSRAVRAPFVLVASASLPPACFQSASSLPPACLQPASSLPPAPGTLVRGYTPPEILVRGCTPPPPPRTLVRGGTPPGTLERGGTPSCVGVPPVRGRLGAK